MLFLGRWLSTQACCARAVLRWLWSAHALGKGTALTRGLSPSARGRGATSQLRPPRISRLLCGTREHGTALAVSREEAQHASLLRARRAALVVVGPCTRQGHCPDKRPLSFGARPWCDVPAAAFVCYRALRWRVLFLIFLQRTRRPEVPSLNFWRSELLALVSYSGRSAYELSRRLIRRGSRGLFYLGCAVRFAGRRIAWQLARLSASRASGGSLETAGGVVADVAEVGARRAGCDERARSRREELEGGG